MRKILLLLTLCICFMANAQSIMGIPLGSSKSEVIKQLEQRGYTVHDEIYELEVFNVRFGGLNYGRATFEFEYVGNSYKFSAATFYMKFEIDEWGLASEYNDVIVNKYYNKYGNDFYDTSVDENGNIVHYFGISPYDKDRPRVIFWMTKDSGMDGVSRYYLTVTYTPAYFTNNEDEI